ncbi:MAG TPA: hypothetical protein VKY19_25505 [Ktedonosporobacter sp.]|jgi:hypothetical protein|nr:hypothetical protein [Ktedonosporobacter sp.]
MSKRNYLLPFMLWCFFLLGLTACSGVFSATPTPPPMPDTVVSTPAPLQGALPTATCDEAVQRILHNEIGLVEIYQTKMTPQYVPNGPSSVVSDIFIYPRSSRTNDPAEPYNPFQTVSISPLKFADQVCYPRVVDAVKQVNTHLAKDQQVQLHWKFTVN